MKINPFLKLILISVFVAGVPVVLVFSYAAKSSFAQPEESQSSFYIPLIGISSVPVPLALPKGPGDVTYKYAVKNFLTEYALDNVGVVDDKCSPVKFIEGDDNSDSKLDYGETWRYTCTTKLFETTQSIATAIGTANNLPAAHKAYATVVVGSDNPYPLVNIINVSKVSYPLTLPKEGGDITFTYRVNNPGVVALSSVVVTDDKCQAMSSKLGDTNGNNLLDISEVWIYTCTVHLTETTTNTVSVTAFAGGLKAVGYSTLTVTVETPNLPDAGDLVPCFQTGLEYGRRDDQIPCLPAAGIGDDFKIITWGILSGALAGLITFYLLLRKTRAMSKIHE